MLFRSVQDQFDDAKEELDSNAEETLSKKPKLKEIAPIGTTENPKPYYTFSSTYGGTISYFGDCKSSTTSATKGENTIQFNRLSAGTYSNCSLKVTSSEGEIPLLNSSKVFSRATTQRLASSEIWILQKSSRRATPKSSCPGFSSSGIPDRKSTRLNSSHSSVSRMPSSA